MNLNGLNFATIFLLTWFNAASDASLIRIPIARHKQSLGLSKSQSKGLDTGNSFSFLQFSIGNNSALPMLDTYDTFYVAEIGLGTPPQRFHINMDTGSSELWVVDSWCSVCNGTKDTFTKTRSSTYANNGTSFTYMYGLGEARGYLGMDSLSVADMKVVNQTFGQATYIDSSFLGQPNDGILGLGFPSLASNGVTPPVQNMVKQGLIDRAVFSVWMEHQGYLDRFAGGEIIFGGVDEQRYTGPIYYQPITRVAYWQIKMDSVYIENTKVTKRNGYQVIVDTGTSFLVGPQDAVGTIVNSIPGSYQSQGFNFIPCSVDKSVLPEIFLIFQGRSYSIQAYNYVIDQNLFGDVCILAIQAGSTASGVDWILGDTFIREWYQIFDFDNRKVGFAKAYATHSVNHQTLKPAPPADDNGSPKTDGVNMSFQMIKIALTLYLTNKLC